MIRAYNFKETLRGLACIPAGLIGFACAWWFFRHVPGNTLRKFGIEVPESWLFLVAVIVLVLIAVSGFRLWRRGGGFSSYQDSGLYHDMDAVSGGSVVADIYLHRVTGPAHLLSQLFLAGPLMLLRAVDHFRNRIRPDARLDESLAATLAMLREINRWQSLSEHPGLEREILLLARMKHIDFSTARGPRLRAYPKEA